MTEDGIETTIDLTGTGEDQDHVREMVRESVEVTTMNAQGRGLETDEGGREVESEDKTPMIENAGGLKATGRGIKTVTGRDRGAGVGLAHRIEAGVVATTGEEVVSN